jgi:hypothetical protein
VLGIFKINFKGTSSWILPRAFCRQLSPNNQNFMQILEGAAIHMQQLLICFFVTSAPI